MNAKNGVGMDTCVTAGPAVMSSIMIVSLLLNIGCTIAKSTIQKEAKLNHGISCE